MQIRTVYSTNDGMNKAFAEPNEHGDVVAIGADDETGVYSVNTLSTKRNENSYAVISRDELKAIYDMIKFELGPDAIPNVKFVDDTIAEEQRVTEWREARRAFLNLAPGHADARTALNRLAEAEDRLYNAT